MQESHEIVIIGAGPAGLTAAYAAYQNGARDIVILERDTEAGGILQQCIHNGFGLRRFKEELTGPGYAHKCLELIKDIPEIKIYTETMVIEINENREVTAMSESGVHVIKAGAIILAMGCRERTRGALRISGTRPAGIYTAGTAQKMINIEGYLPGHEVVIVGSGDIGLIMARRLTLEGCKVKRVVEIAPESHGLKRNIVQCLEDYDIPLLLSHTVVQIKGKDRVESVVIAKVDEKFQMIEGTEEEVTCDTLLLSAGLIPENELSRNLGLKMDPKTRGPEVSEDRETSVPGIFAAGNVVKVHDLADSVSDEADIAGKAAALFCQKNK